ncbi:MAG TPA: FG-GAP-like repeat-containing protein, partial [Paludibacter sp.]|nr:FG-GAP-like repeat-containing protein [Paludibacter sp.]
MKFPETFFHSPLSPEEEVSEGREKSGDGGIPYTMQTRYKHIILSAALCLWAMAGRAQAPQPVYTLTDNQSGTTKNYVARDLVGMKNGFSFKAATGQSFSARIDPALTCPISYTAEGDLPDGTRDLKKKAVGTLAGSAGVNPMGQATYSIPIDLPPGTAGMTPTLSIGYNSGGGIGALGKGWTLGGLSAITATGDNYFLDGKVGNLDFYVQDPQYHLALDGNRLIWADGAYHTQNETFSRITASGDGYQVETKDGKVMEYGKTANSRQLTQDGANVVGWHLNKITDPNGNYIRYNYYNDAASGEFRLESIEYTGNEGSSLAPYNKVQLVYTTKADPNTTYVSGSPVLNNVVLHAIRVTSEGALAWQYGFKYTDNGGTRLSEVVQSGSDGATAYNSTIIDWGRIPANYPVMETGKFITNSNDVIADMDGDGKADIYNRPENSDNSTLDHYVFDNEKNNFEATLDQYYNYPYNRTDINGDGKDDIWEVKYDSDGKINGISLAYFGRLPFDNTKKYCIGDFDGDGLKDVFLYNSAGDWDFYTINGGSLSKHSGTGFPSQLTVCSWNNSAYSVPLNCFDYNGDGKAEFIGYDLATSQTVFYSFDGTFTEIEKRSGYWAPQSNQGWHDFNGDGVPDFEKEENLLLTINYNQKTNQTKTISSFGSLAGNIVYEEPVFGDFNGDHKTDILFHASTQDLRTYKFLVRYSTGDDFTPLTEVASYTFGGDSIGYIYKPIVCDINGDGVDDIYYQVCNLDEKVIAKIWETHLVLFTNANASQFVRSITNGLNEKTEFTYTTLNDYGVYTPGSGAVSPVVDYQGSEHVVSAVKTGNGLGGQTGVDYRYEGLKLHKQGLGMLGFAKTTQTNTATGISREDSYSYDPVYFATYLSKSETKAPDGTTLAETSYANAIKEYGGKRIFSYTSGMVSTDKLKSIASTTSGISGGRGHPANVRALHARRPDPQPVSRRA